MIGGGKGVIRSMLCNGALKSEIIPVDTAISGLILLPYQLNRMEKKPAQIPVYNLTVVDSKKRTWKWVMDVGRYYALKYPFEIGLWYPDGNMTTNKFYHWFCVVMFMWLPAYFIDALLFLFRQRRFMVRVQTKIGIGLEMLQFFTTRDWDFKSTNFEQMNDSLTPRDREIFRIGTDDIDEDSYLRACILGGRQYVLKEPLSSLPKSRIYLNILFVLDRVCKVLFVGWFLYWLSLKLGIAGLVRTTIEMNTMKA